MESTPSIIRVSYLAESARTTGTIVFEGTESCLTPYTFQLCSGDYFFEDIFVRYHSQLEAELKLHAIDSNVLSMLHTSTGSRPKAIDYHVLPEKIPSLLEYMLVWESACRQLDHGCRALRHGPVSADGHDWDPGYAIFDFLTLSARQLSDLCREAIKSFDNFAQFTAFFSTPQNLELCRAIEFTSPLEIIPYIKSSLLPHARRPLKL